MLALFLATSGQSGSPGPTPPPPTSIAQTPAELSVATLDDSLTVEGVPIAGRASSRRLTVAVRIDGSEPVQFVVDTGADRSVVGRSLAQRLVLRSAAHARVHGVAGVLEAPMVAVARLDVGSSGISDLDAPSLPEAFLGADGIVGLDAIGEQRLLMDFDSKSITVQDARRPERSQGDDIVVVARRRHGQLILARVDVGGIATDAVIDTGAEVTMGNSVLQLRLASRRMAGASSQTEIIGVTGQRLAVTFLTIPRMSIGRLAIANVGMVFADAPPFEMFGLTQRPAVLLGVDVLSQLKRVSLDFRRKTIRFELRKGR